MLIALKNWTIALARSKQAEPALFTISFIESSFFPIPPDVVLGPMAYADPSRWRRYAFVCTIASVLGGLFGYAIGYFFFSSIGQPIVDAFGYGDKIEEVRGYYDEHGIWFVLVAGITPIPFKLFTILSGFFNYFLPTFLVGCILSRGVRFFLVAWLFQKYGPSMAEMMERRIGLFSLIAVGLVVLAIIAYMLLHS